MPLWIHPWLRIRRKKSPESAAIRSVRCRRKMLWHFFRRITVIGSASKTARGSSAVGGQEVESMHARCVCMRLGGDPSLSLFGSGQCPFVQIFRFLILKRHIFVDCLALKFIFITKRCPDDRTHGMQCMVVDGGRVIIRSKPFIDSEWYEPWGCSDPPRGLKFGLMEFARVDKAARSKNGGVEN